MPRSSAGIMDVTLEALIARSLGIPQGTEKCLAADLG